MAALFSLFSKHNCKNVFICLPASFCLSKTLKPKHFEKLNQPLSKISRYLRLVFLLFRSLLSIFTELTYLPRLMVMDTPLLETLEPNSVPHQNLDGSSFVLRKQTLDGHFLAPPSSNSGGVSPILVVKKTLDQSSISPSNDAITGSEPSMEGAKIVDDNHNNYQQALVLYDASNLDGSLGAGRIGENQSCYVLKDEDNEGLYDDGSPYRQHRDDDHHDVDDPDYRVSPQSHLAHSSNDWGKRRFVNKDWWSPHGESLEIKPTGVGAGLENLGNTCFINAILQCFTHTVPFVQGLRSCNHVKPCHGASEGFCVVCTLCDHIDLSLASSGKVISPTKLFENLNYISSSFERYQQEDAHEFLQCLLDRLEQCCLDIKKMDKSLPSPGDNNIVERTFGGLLISKLRCCNCGHCSDTYEPLIDLSLEIEDVDSLQSALESFTKLEKIEDSETKFTCENCKEVVSVEKQLMLDRAPSVAAFHLKRFKTDGSSIVKIDKHVEFPLELDLQPYTSDDENSDVESKYQLYAIVEHTGYSPTYGHYFSYIRSSPGTWHRLNDSRVTRVQEEFVLSQDAYILFYSKQGTAWFSSLLEAEKLCLDRNISNLSPKSVLDNMDNDCTTYCSVAKANDCEANESRDSAGGSSAQFSCERRPECVEVNEIKDDAEGISACQSSGSRQNVIDFNGAGNDAPIISSSVDFNDARNDAPIISSSVTLRANECHDGIFNSEKIHKMPSLEENNCNPGVDKLKSNDAFHPLTPPRSPSPDVYSGKPSETSYHHISSEHLKLENKVKCKRTLEQDAKDLERQEALRCLNKNMSGSRRSKLMAAINDGSSNKKRKLNSSPCRRRASPRSGRRKHNHSSVARRVTI
ncbi:hypothetical protein Dsin_030303 [Dipteronia sinensis]|uniref:Ubiquitin carboxyl-terminal hydrolase n=1 Tax=Dipteronia sinensis TaxID=43782 RepID=A0AAE0DR52_9ROSI|nr:hypothetical protein Dsin_030303 [Dipteronia sinensis]